MAYRIECSLKLERAFSFSPLKEKIIEYEINMVYYINNDIEGDFMKKDSYLKMTCIYVFAFFVFFLFSSGDVKAAEYIYESGNVKETYDNVTVIDFNYDYITEFNAATNYYDGVQLRDEENRLDNEDFYSGRKIDIKVNHVDKWIGKDDDSVYVYRYNSVRNDFAAAYSSLVNKSGTLTLDKDGLYKVVYKFDGKVKYTKYIYICTTVNYLEIDVDERYDNVPAYESFVFFITLRDSYDLKDYEYYYSFDKDGVDFSYTELNFFTDDESNDSTSIKTIENRRVVVDIKDEYKTSEGEKSRLYVFARKVTNGENVEKMAYTEKTFSLCDKLVGVVSFVEEDFTTLSSKRTFKIGEKINLVININAPITYENLQYSFDGGKTYLNLENVTEETNQIKLSYQFTGEDDYKTELRIRKKGSSSAIVVNNGLNIKLSLENNEEFSVDVNAPVIDKITPYKDEDDPDSVYNLTLKVTESNLDKVYYYAAVCNDPLDGGCLDNFDADNPNMVVLDSSEIENISKIPVVVDSRFGRYNGTVLTLFVKVVDKVGNVTFSNEYKYNLDTVIVPEDEFEGIFIDEDVERVIDEEAEEPEYEVVGKRVKIVTPIEYTIWEIRYYLDGVDYAIGCDYDWEQYENGIDIFYCHSVEDYSFRTMIKYEFEDHFGNIETYYRMFDYNAGSNGTVFVGNYVINTYNNASYDALIELRNVVGIDTDKVVFNQEGMEELKSIMKLELIPELTDFKKSFVYLGEEEISLIDIVGNTLNIPTMLEILEKIGPNEQYGNCALSGNVCDIDTYLKFEYNTDGVPQTRYVKFKLLDKSHKYLIDNFNSNIEIEVNGQYTELNYKMMTALNVELQAADVTKNIKITYTSKDGVSQEVSSIDTSKVGLYDVEETFKYLNESSFPLSYRIAVVDKIAPTVTVKNQDSITIKAGDELDDFLAYVEASDNYDSSLTIEYEIEPEFDNRKSGTYTIKYWAVDSSGNMSSIVTKTLVVEKDSSLTTYIIIGGIVLVVLAVIFVAVRKEKKKRNND